MKNDELKTFSQTIEEGKRIFLDGIWYKKIEGTLKKEIPPIKSFVIEVCPFCKKEILKEDDRKSFKDWGMCLSCYYHKGRKNEKSV